MPAPAADPDTLAAVLTLVSAIERRGDADPAVLGFRAALTRRGREIAAAGGPAALADVLARVRADDLARAAPRTAIIGAAWGELLSGQEQEAGR